jgi:hypothetical protein
MDFIERFRQERDIAVVKFMVAIPGEIFDSFLSSHANLLCSGGGVTACVASHPVVVE